MKMTVQFVLFLSGLSALSTNVLGEYHYIKMLKTWREAQSYCREMFTDLVTVRNKDGNNRLLSVSQGCGKYGWIGLYDDLTRWKWALGKADFNDVTDFSKWVSYKVLSKKAGTSCVVMTVNGFWDAITCWQQRPAVCFNAKGPSTYILVETKMTWHQAKAYCRSKYTDLVSVRNLTENKHISSLLSRNSWIGLHRKHWAYWSDQSPTTFKNWASGQPNNTGDNRPSCALVNTTTGKWENTDCEAKHHFICEKVHIEHKITFKLKYQSEADLNHPAVQRQVLEQLHAKLEKHGLPDFKLRWMPTDGQTFHKEQKRTKEEGQAAEQSLCSGHHVHPPN